MFATSILARPIEARDSAVYGDLAKGLQDVLRRVTEPPASPEIVAAELVYAVLADGGPLRWACDPVGRRVVDSPGTAALEANLTHLGSRFWPRQ